MYANNLIFYFALTGPACKKATTPANQISAFKHLQLKLRSTSRKLEQPLPMPFELPQNYPAIVMVDLEQRKLSTKARTKFMASISAAIFRHKSYPSREEYGHVRAQIVNK